MLAMYRKCALKYKESIEDDWQPRFRGGALGHGVAVHAGLAAWYRGSLDGLSGPQRVDLAFAALTQAWPEDQPVDDFRTLSRAQELLLTYIKEYPQESFQILAVEVPFTLPLRDPEGKYRWLDCGNSFPDTFDPTLGRTFCPGKPLDSGNCDICGRPCESIEYGGIFDLNVQYGAGKYSTIYVMDHKTTSVLGPTFFLQFKPNAQITGYVWADTQLSDRKVAGAIINALCLTRGGNIVVGKREITDRSDADIREWISDTVWTCNAIRESQRTGVWPKSDEECQGKYGMCGYHGIHVLTEPHERQARRETDYIQRKWDYEDRDGTNA